MEFSPVTLEGAHVRLEPLSLEHVPGLVEAAREWGITLEHAFGALGCSRAEFRADVDNVAWRPSAPND